jgi:F0F1-type ATP synthase assembly protein I
MLTDSILLGASLSTERPSPVRPGGTRPPADPRSQRRILLLAAGMTGSVAGGMILGYFIDQRYDTEPRWTVILGITCLASALYQLVRESLR